MIEITVPIYATPNAFSGAKAVVATPGHDCSAPADDADLNFYTTEPLPKLIVMRVHTESEDYYTRSGQGYRLQPSDFTMLRKGGGCDRTTGTIVFQFRRTFHHSGATQTPALFRLGLGLGFRGPRFQM